MLVKLAAGAAVLGLLWYATARVSGAITAATGAVGKGFDRAAEIAIQIADDVATGTTQGVGEIGEVVGLPTPDQTIDDPRQVRYIIDHRGRIAASKWGTAGAYLRAELMAAGTGLRLDPRSAAAMALGLGNSTTGDFSRMDRPIVQSEPLNAPWRMDLPGGDVLPW